MILLQAPALEIQILTAGYCVEFQGKTHGYTSLFSLTQGVGRLIGEYRNPVLVVPALKKPTKEKNHG